MNSTILPLYIGILGLQPVGSPPVDLKIAFIGDQDDGEDAIAVLELILSEGAAAVSHQGDFDYHDDPQSWMALINDVLGPDFPYFASVGNHDEDEWRSPGGYQDLLERRFLSQGIPWEGDLGERSTHSFGGVRFVMVAPDLFGSGDNEYAPYMQAQFAQATDAAWRVGSWHVLMEAMQVGGKDDQSGWGVYETCRQYGAIAATGHEHSYARTHLLSNMTQQIVADDDFDYELSEGATIAFHNGLGGRNIRDQERCFPTTPPYGCNGEWAAIYAEQQNATFGALFVTFGYQGDPCRARGYFKNVDGQIIDEFFLTSRVGPCAGGDPLCDVNLDGDVNVLDLIDLLLCFGLPAEPGCEAQDVNQDGMVNTLDLIDLRLCFDPPADPGCESEDVNQDGTVNVLDLIDVLLCVGQPAVPGCESEDVNQDGTVNALDLTDLLPCFGIPGVPGAGACREDVNGDGTTNVLDLIDLLLCFGLPAVPGCEAEDVNGDGTVNVLDLIDLLLAFGTACPKGQRRRLEERATMLPLHERHTGQDGPYEGRDHPR